jgi:hypothetical protein
MADAREVSEEEFGLAFIGLMFEGLPTEDQITPLPEPTPDAGSHRTDGDTMASDD